MKKENKNHKPEDVCECGHFSWNHEDCKGRCRSFLREPKRKCKCEKFKPKEDSIK